ncbi:ANTAR domain-containing protein [Streptomyces sp. NPDC087440]|uniref:ANTAR domain-containing protein n=1 Tax=Streptomyces sp. NPDC087440 TaxID=3365790 RepID=UPI00382BE3B1
MSTPEQHLADAFVTVAASLGHAYDVPAFLDVLATTGRDLLEAHAAGAVLVLDAAQPARVAGSDPQVALLEEEAAQGQEGPGHDCRRTGETLDVTLGAESAGLRWPRYTARARELGYARVAALPLRGHDERVGALVLLRGDEDPLSPGALALGRALADAATIALLRERALDESRRLTAQLEQALSSRIVIEQAKGVLASRLTLSVDEAFVLLRRHARAHQRKLSDVAMDVVGGRM